MTAELTVFATPKPFVGPFARIQRNAVRTWASLGPAVEVVIIGDDEGSAEIADEVGALHVPVVRRSPKNVPLLDDLFGIGQSVGTAPTCVFVNADIMLTDDIIGAVGAVRRTMPGPSLVVGQRWDLDVVGDVSIDDDDWGARLRRVAREEGRCNSPLWVDWFAFPRGQYPTLPPFVVGRPGYDHWLVWHTLERQIPVVDASAAVTAVHQHHDYSHGGTHHSVWFGEDAQTNRSLIGDRNSMRHIGHATHQLDADLHVREARGTKYVLSRAHTRLGPVLERTMRVRHRFGIDADMLQSIAARSRRT